MGLMDTVALYCVLSAGQLANPQFASVASSIFGLVTVLLAWMFLRERLNLVQWGGTLMTFSGVGYLGL
jgi:drug/metabolite transporter (DMT)-like permease